jgi:predicted GIY-YIG superfamily endonuclease
MTDYLCYILASSDHKKTYVGITNNLHRRLRQHNGEICGGAKSTKHARPWSVATTITGFRSRSEALMFEWAMHHTRGKGGVTGRMAKLRRVMTLTKWTSRSPPAADVPLVVTHTLTPVVVPVVTQLTPVVVPVVNHMLTAVVVPVVTQLTAVAVPGVTQLTQVVMVSESRT